MNNRFSALLFSVTLLSAGRAGADTGSPVYLATIPPVADLIETIVEGRGKVIRLLPAGASPHTYEPKPSDLRAASSALAILFVDRRLDGWAAGLPGPEPVPIFPMLPDSFLLHFEEGDGGHDHSGDHHGAGGDPHFWTDPLAVKAVVPLIASRLGQIDRAGRVVYERNAAALVSRLDSLHAGIAARTEEIRGMTVLLSHPFLRYWIGRYGLGVVGMIEEIPGKEPTARSLAGTIRLAREAGARAIVVQPQLSRRAAELVSESTGIGIVVVDPLGGGPGRETYEEILMSITDAMERGIR